MDGFFPTPNWLFDEYWSDLSGAELKLIGFLLRYGTKGLDFIEVHKTVAQMQVKTGLSKSTVLIGLAKLEARGLLSRQVGRYKLIDPRKRNHEEGMKIRPRRV